jgi:hypothetical protein
VNEQHRYSLRDVATTRILSDSTEPGAMMITRGMIALES